MNKRARKIFALILDNEIVALNTTLKKFHTYLIENEFEVGSYITLFRKFEANERFTMELKDKIYHLQKFSPPADSKAKP